VNASADGPLLLSVDDLQLCDRSSLRFLSYLSRRLDGLPVVVLGGYRTAGEPPGDATIADLVQDPATEVIEPQPLTVDAVGAGAAPARRWRPGAGRRPHRPGRLETNYRRRPPQRLAADD
jgi:hypothetical protein